MRRGRVILEISLKYLLVLKLFLQKVWPYTCDIVDTGEETRMLTFHFIQVLNGTICQRNEDCDRGKMEECQKHKDINLKICIRKIHLYILTFNI